MQPVYEKPWPCPADHECYWYHSMQFSDGPSVEGSWTIPDFNDYIGGYVLEGKTVLDVGTASGYLAFAAEKAGAKVTAIDAASTNEFRLVPFASALSFTDIGASRRRWEK